MTGSKIPGHGPGLLLAAGQHRSVQGQNGGWDTWGQTAQTKHNTQTPDIFALPFRVCKVTEEKTQ